MQHVLSLPRRSSHSPPPAVVRMVAVVQDQLDLEFYRSLSSSSPSQLRDRQPLILAPLSSSPPPSSSFRCTPWFRNSIVGNASSRTNNDSDGNDNDLDHPDRPTKRLRRGGRPLDVEYEYKEEEEWPREEDMEETGRVNPQDPPPFVVAKLYYDQYAPGCRRRLQLNEVVEVVGVLEWSEEVEEVGNGNSLFHGEAYRDHDEADLSQQPQWSYDSWEGVDHWVAPPQAPILHVLWFQATDLDRLAADAVSVRSPVPPSTLATLPPSQLLAQSLSVSDTSGAAIWMALLSLAERQIVSLPADEAGDDTPSTLWAPVETPQETTLGCASLKLVTANREACDQLHDRLIALLSGVVPLVQALAIQGPDDGLPSLPAKIAGRLHASPLQLPKGSTLILNVGACDPIAVAALAASSTTKAGGTWKALQDLTNTHKLQYTFEGIPIAFEADLRIVVVSTPTTKHLLPCTLQCAVTTTTTGSNNVEQRADRALTLRLALAQARGVASTADKEDDDRWVTNIGFSKPVLDRAQQDFLQRRQWARKQPNVVLPNEADFHRWLTLTRLQARSRNASMAEVPDWEQALALDDAMVASLQQ